jgi:acyl-ACP thioesterase
VYIIFYTNPYGGILLVHHEDFIVRSYEVDFRGKASASSICNYLQEVAGNHATKLGVAVDHLFKKNMTWVLSRLHVQFIRFPFWREKIHVETWPSGKKGKYATRDFLISDQKNNIIVKGTSSWMVLDLKTLRPISLPDFMDDIDSPDKERAINDNFQKLSIPKNPEIEKQFNVRLNDLDINQHVNNVKYIEWALGSIPLEDWKKKELAALEISYRAETKYGERVSVLTEQNRNKVFHQVLSSNDQRSLAVLVTDWNY